MQRQAGNLAAHGVETAEDDGIGRVVDDYLHTRERLQGTDVTTLTTNDAALHLLILQIEDADGVLHGGLRGGALYRLDDDFLSLLVGGDLGLLNDVHDACGGIGLGLLGHHLHQVLFGLLGGHAGDVFELLDALVIYLLHFGLAFAQHLNLVVEVLAHLLQLLALFLQVAHLLIEGVLALFQLALLLAQLGVTLAHLLLVLTLHLDEFLLGLQDFILLDDFAFFLGVFQHFVASFNHLFALGQQLVVLNLRGGNKACNGTHDDTNNNSYYYIHLR